MDLGVVEFILAIISVIIIPIAGILIKNWADVQQLNRSMDEVKVEIKELEKDKIAHAQTLAIIEQKLLHIEQSITQMNANITQLITIWDEKRNNQKT